MREMMLGPPRKFSKILISRFIFFFFTGFIVKQQRVSETKTTQWHKLEVIFTLTFRIFTTTFSLLVMLMASNTSLYFPRPSFLTNWKSSWFLCLKKNQTSMKFKKLQVWHLNNILTPTQQHETHSPSTLGAGEYWLHCRLWPDSGLVLTCPTAWQR